MTPKVGSILVYNFRNASTSVAPIRVVSANVEKDVYILQNQITGQTEQYTSAQLDLYFHYD